MGRPLSVRRMRMLICAICEQKHFSPQRGRRCRNKNFWQEQHLWWQEPGEVTGRWWKTAEPGEVAGCWCKGGRSLSEKWQDAGAKNAGSLDKEVQDAECQKQQELSEMTGRWCEMGGR